MSKAISAASLPVTEHTTLLHQYDELRKYLDQLMIWSIDNSEGRPVHFDSKLNDLTWAPETDARMAKWVYHERKKSFAFTNAAFEAFKELRMDLTDVILPLIDCMLEELRSMEISTVSVKFENYVSEELLIIKAFGHGPLHFARRGHQ